MRLANIVKKKRLSEREEKIKIASRKKKIIT